MREEKYLGYLAEICRGEDPPLAADIGERMLSKFHGACYELVDGAPAGHCLRVEGSDPRICERIREWIDSNH